jgi:hypothetical protein
MGLEGKGVWGVKMGSEEAWRVEVVEGVWGVEVVEGVWGVEVVEGVWVVKVGVERVCVVKVGREDCGREVER